MLWSQKLVAMWAKSQKDVMIRLWYKSRWYSGLILPLFFMYFMFKRIKEWCFQQKNSIMGQERENNVCFGNAIQPHSSLIISFDYVIFIEGVQDCRGQQWYVQGQLTCAMLSIAWGWGGTTANFSPLCLLLTAADVWSMSEEQPYRLLIYSFLIKNLGPAHFTASS